MPRWFRRPLRAFRMALGLYTAIPGFAFWDEDAQGLLLPALPAVGLLLGGLWAAAAWALRLLLPPLLSAVAVALFLPALTGFLHLDGYMDVADALLSSRPREDKLRILKDPHTGAFAVIALVSLFALQTAAVAEWLPAASPSLLALAPLPVVSRCLAALWLMTAEPLPQSQYGRMGYDAATRGKRLFCLLWLLAAVGLAFFAGWRAGLACLFAALAFCLSALRATKALGGMNGDIAGSGICWAEACGLILLACI